MMNKINKSIRDRNYSAQKKFRESLMREITLCERQ